MTKLYLKIIKNLTLTAVVSSLFLYTNLAIAQEGVSNSTAVRYLDIKHKKDIKVIFKVSSGELKKGINKGLYYIRHLLDHYKNNGVDSKNVHIVAVFYGEASSALLVTNRVKENFKIVQELAARGVSFELCGESKQIRKIPDADLISGVSVATGAYARSVDLQLDGYALINL